MSLFSALGKCSVDTGANGLRSPRLRLHRRSRRPGRNHLRRDHWLGGGAAFLQFPLHTLFGARIEPIPPAIPQGNREGETGGCPNLERGKGERSREIQCNGEDAYANNIGSRQVEVMDEKISDHSAK